MDHETSATETRTSEPAQPGQPQWHRAIARIRSLVTERPEPEPVRVDPTLALHAAKVPLRLQRVLADVDMSNPYVQRTRAWATASAEAWCLVLSGPQGVGKSVAAAWWLYQRIVERSKGSFEPRMWWPATDIARAGLYSSTLDSVHSVPELVLDDLGAEYWDEAGAFQANLDSLIDARYRDYRRTIITTNVNLQEFRRRYGERIYDRLRDGGAFFEEAFASQRRPVR